MFDWIDGVDLIFDNDVKVFLLMCACLCVCVCVRECVCVCVFLCISGCMIVYQLVCVFFTFSESECVLNSPSLPNEAPLCPV